MKRVKTLQEFYNLNHRDLIRIVSARFKNCVRHDYQMEDLIQDFYCHMARNQVIEKYDPEKKVLFSTYIFTCLRNFCCSYILQKTNRRTDFYKNTISIEEIKTNKRGSTYLLSEIIKGSDDIYLEHDLQFMLEKIEKYEENKSWPSRLNLATLFKLYYEGYTDTNIAKEYNVTSACIGAKKRKIREILLSSVEGAELCKSFKQVSKYRYCE